MADIPEKVNEHNEVPAAKHFVLHAIFDEEHKRVVRWLEAEANEAVRRPDASDDTANAHGRVLLERIRNSYGNLNIDVNRELLARAMDGTLKQHVPNRSLVLTYNGLKWIALTGEILVGLGIWFMGEGTPVLILVATMLALAGWLAGNGVGGLLSRRLGAHLPPSLGTPPTLPPYSDIIKVVVGFGTIIGLSYLRAVGEEGEGAITVIGFTVLLALLVAMFEALHGFTSNKYEFLRGQMAVAQRVYAINKHAEALVEYEMAFQNKHREIRRDFSRALKNGVA